MQQLVCSNKFSLLSSFRVRSTFSLFPKNMLCKSRISHSSLSLLFPAQWRKNVQQKPALWVPDGHHGAACQWRSCLSVWKQRFREWPVGGGWGELWAAATWQREATEEHLQREDGGYYLPDQRYPGGWHPEQHFPAVPLLSTSVLRPVCLSFFFLHWDSALFRFHVEVDHLLSSLTLNIYTNIFGPLRN